MTMRRRGYLGPFGFTVVRKLRVGDDFLFKKRVYRVTRVSRRFIGYVVSPQEHEYHFA